jgi:pentatricopeptide repeat protein
LTRGTYTALVVASGRAGELRRAFEAADLMRAAGYEPDDTTWRELLSSCARAGDADLAWRTYKQSRESGCPPNDVALNIIVGVTLLKIRELTDPDNRANRRQQIDADAANLVDPETGERVESLSGAQEPERDPEGSRSGRSGRIARSRCTTKRRWRGCGRG